MARTRTAACSRGTRRTHTESSTDSDTNELFYRRGRDEGHHLRHKLPEGCWSYRRIAKTVELHHKDYTASGRRRRRQRRHLSDGTKRSIKEKTQILFQMHKKYYSLRERIPESTWNILQLNSFNHKLKSRDTMRTSRTKLLLLNDWLDSLVAAVDNMATAIDIPRNDESEQREGRRRSDQEGEEEEEKKEEEKNNDSTDELRQMLQSLLGPSGSMTMTVQASAPEPSIRVRPTPAPQQALPPLSLLSLLSGIGQSRPRTIFRARPRPQTQEPRQGQTAGEEGSQTQESTGSSTNPYNSFADVFKPTEKNDDKTNE